MAVSIPHERYTQPSSSRTTRRVMIKGESATINFVGVFLFLKASAARFPTATELTKDRFDLQGFSTVRIVRTRFFNRSSSFEMARLELVDIVSNWDNIKGEDKILIFEKDLTLLLRMWGKRKSLTQGTWFHISKLLQIRQTTPSPSGLLFFHHASASPPSPNGKHSLGSRGWA